MQVPSPENTHTSFVPKLTSKITLKDGLFASIAVLSLAIVWDPKILERTRSTALDLQCTAKASTSQLLTASQLTELTQTREGTAKKTVQSRLPKAYCQLSNLSVRAGAVAQREVFQLSSSSWMVVMYEGDRFMGSRQVIQ